MSNVSAGAARDWNGREIRVDRSPGGVLLFCDVDDALIRAETTCWPPPQVVMKLGAAQHESKVPASVRQKLGHYSALQSINSQDAITWNFFGGLINRPEAGAASSTGCAPGSSCRGRGTRPLSPTCGAAYLTLISRLHPGRSWMRCSSATR